MYFLGVFLRLNVGCLWELSHWTFGRCLLPDCPNLFPLLIFPHVYSIFTTMQLFHKHTGLNTPLPLYLWLFLFSIRTHTHLWNIRTDARHIKYTHRHNANAHTAQIQPERLLCGIHNQSSRLESLSTTSDVTSACSVSCSSPTPFLFPLLFHQLNPSFDTSEGVPHMPVTSLLLHRCFLLGFLSRARVSVWNLCTL